jgi:hypothetical protein
MTKVDTDPGIEATLSPRCLFEQSFAPDGESGEKEKSGKEKGTKTERER